MTSEGARNEDINEPTRSSYRGLETSTNMDKNLFPLSQPQIEDPERGSNGPTLMKDGIAGDSISTKGPGKEEEMQSTVDAEILEEILSEGENLQLQALQPPSGDKVEVVDDRTTTEEKQIDEEEGTDKERKSLLSGCQGSTPSTVMASSGPVMVNSASNCNENDMVSSPPLLDQHVTLENKGIVQQAQVASSMDTTFSQPIHHSTLSRASTIDEGEVLNVGDHFRQENGMDLNSLENKRRPVPSTCDVRSPSDSTTTTRISSVGEVMLTIHATTKSETTLKDNEQDDPNILDKQPSSRSLQDVEEHVMLRKGEPSETNDSISSCKNTCVFENDSTTRSSESEANNIVILPTDEAGIKDTMLLEEDHHLSADGEGLLPPTFSVQDEINFNAPINSNDSIDSDKSMLEGNGNNNVSKREEEEDFINENDEEVVVMQYGTTLSSPDLEDHVCGGNIGAAVPQEENFQPSTGDIVFFNEIEEEENTALPNVVIEKAAAITTVDNEMDLLEPLLELSRQKTTNDEIIESTAISSDIGGIDNGVHDLELFTSEPEEGEGDNLLEKKNDQSGPHTNAQKNCSHSLSPQYRSKGSRHHGRTTIERPLLTIEDIFQNSSTINTPQDINDTSFSDELILTPRSAKACATNGVKPALLRQHDMESFWEPGIDPSIQKLKYDMYNRRRYQLMKICRNEKARLEEEEAAAAATTQKNATLSNGEKKGLHNTRQRRFQKGKDHSLSMIEREKHKIENLKRQRLKEAEQQLAWEMKQKEIEEKIRAREEKETLAAAKLVRETQRRQCVIAEERRMKEIRKKAEATMEAARQQILVREEHEKSLRLAQKKLKEETKAKEIARLRGHEAMERKKRFKLQTQLFFEQKNKEALVAETERNKKEELRRNRVAKQRKAALDTIAAAREQRKKRIEMNIEHNEISYKQHGNGGWGDRVIWKPYYPFC